MRSRSRTHPGTQPGSKLSWRDRVIAALARALAGRFFRSVETVGTIPRQGPVILAASHLNGFVDPVLLVSELKMLPRFLAKGTLWKVWIARPFLRFARIIPVHRRQDSDGTVDNRATFSTAIEALASGGVIAVFPEGTTHDESTLRPLRTGVARIALQATAEGVADLQVVPVGITYQDKVTLRSRALVEFGEPIVVDVSDAVLGPDGTPIPDAVHALTETIRVSLAQLSVDFDCAEEALALSAAATVSLRQVNATEESVPMADVARRARRIAKADPATVDRLISTVARYQMLLHSVGLTDHQLVGRTGPRQLARRSMALALLILVLAPIGIAGLFANMVPVLLVAVAGLVPSAPVSKGTIRVLVAAVTFPAWWLAIAVFDVGLSLVASATRLVTFPVQPLLTRFFGDRSGFASSLVVFVALPLFGMVTVLLFDRARSLVDNVLTYRTLVDRRGQLPEIRTKRDAVVAATLAALEHAPRS